MDHSLHTAIIDRNGRLVANLEGNEFSAEQLGDLVATVLSRVQSEYDENPTFSPIRTKLEQPFWAASLLSNRYTPDRNQQSFRERDLHHHPCGGIVRKEFSKKAIQFSEVGDIRHEYGGVHH